jgi:hypothetical protein
MAAVLKEENRTILLQPVFPFNTLMLFTKRCDAVLSMYGLSFNIYAIFRYSFARFIVV